MSVKYAPVGPIYVLQQLRAINALGDYLLLIAPDILKHPDKYRSLAVTNPAFVIMDNGTIELGTPLPVLRLLEAADIVQADCIVLPDELRSFPNTMKLVESQLEDLHAGGYDLMKVPQGEDIQEIVKCIDWLCDTLGTGGNDYWGIPRWFASELGSRIPIIQYINMRNDNPQIHLLGMSTNLKDDLRCTLLPGIMGIDSANPIILGLQGNRMSTDPYAHVERGDYWEQSHLTSRAVENVQYIRDAIG